MKALHIPAKIQSKVDIPEDFIEDLPETVAVFTTIQLIDNMESFIEQIESTGRNTKTFKTGHTRNKGQILGCNVQPWQEYGDVAFDAFVYIGDGLFHPRALIWKNKDKEVYGYNPFTEEQYTVDNSEVQKIRKRYHAAVSHFHLKKEIGVLVTTKPGQMLLRRARELRDEYPNKNFYYFIDNTYDFSALDDFNFVDVWVNTACPRISFEDQIHLEKPVVNMEDVKKENARRALIR